MFKDERLLKDRELLELRKKCRELGGDCPGYNYDEYKGWDDYIQACRDEYGRLKRQAQSH